MKRRSSATGAYDAGEAGTDNADAVHVGRVALARIANKEGFKPEDVFLSPVEPAALIDPWGRSYRLFSRFLVGRSREHVDLAIRDDVVSQKHAELTFDRIRRAWLITDCGSTNGTYVAGKRVEGETCLHNHQVIEFGNVALLFTLLSVPPTARRSSRWW